jgi:hypothetical protein
LAGHWLESVQPHLPPTHWLAPVHGPHAAPLVPHAALVVLVMQVPVESQQPPEQLAGVHLLAQEPPVHAWASVHDWHELPPLPQAALDSSV